MYAKKKKNPIMLTCAGKMFIWTAATICNSDVK